MDKWDKQGGSNRDNINKPRKKKRISELIIRPLKSLKESDSVSPKIVAQKKPTAQYGQFGDEVQFIVDPIADLILPEVVINEYDNYEYTLPSSTVNPVKIYEFTDPLRENKSEIIQPRGQVLDRYEIFAKFNQGTFSLLLMPGQAYMARTGINNERFDRSLVILSEEPILFQASQLTPLSSIEPSTVNVLRLNAGVTSEYRIIDSLYNWINQSMALITDITGQESDPILASINTTSAPFLPPINFTLDSDLYGLFGASGRQVDQICLAAIDKVLEFDRNPELVNLRLEPYSVLLAGARIAVCSPRFELPPLDRDYRVIAVFFTIESEGFRLGGYDKDNSSQNLVAPRRLNQLTIQNDPGLNIIKPGSEYWSDLRPRLKVTSIENQNETITFVEPFWQFSYFSTNTVSNLPNIVFVDSSNNISELTATKVFSSGYRSSVYSGNDTRIYAGETSADSDGIENNNAGFRLLDAIGFNSLLFSPYETNRSEFGFDRTIELFYRGIYSTLVGRFGPTPNTNRLPLYGMWIIRPTGIEYKMYQVNPTTNVSINTGFRIPENGSIPLSSQGQARTFIQSGNLVSAYSIGQSAQHDESDFSGDYFINVRANLQEDRTYVADTTTAGVNAFIEQSTVRNESSTRSQSQGLKVKITILFGQITIFKELELLNNEFNSGQTNSSFFVSTDSGQVINPSEPNLSARRTRFESEKLASYSGTGFYRDNSIDPKYSIDNVPIEVSQVQIDMVVNSFLGSQSIDQSITVPIQFDVESTKISEFTCSANFNATSSSSFSVTGRIPGNESSRDTRILGDRTDNVYSSSVSTTLVKAKSFEILESINFTVITSNKIYSCKTTILLSEPIQTTSQSVRVEGSLVTQLGFRSEALEVIKDETYKIRPLDNSFFQGTLTIQNTNFFFTDFSIPTTTNRSGTGSPTFTVSDTTTNNTTGFDSQYVNTKNIELYDDDDGFYTINLPHNTLPFRRVTGMVATIKSIKNHSIPNYLPTGKSRVLIPNMRYFNPNQSTLTKANPDKPEDNGLVGRIFRTSKRTQVAATVENWGIRDNGELFLDNLTNEPLGEYPGLTQRIFYYPGDT